MDFEAFINDIQKNNRNVFGAELYEGNRLSGAFGDTDKNRHPIYSATKTVTSLAVGMAQDDGKIDTDKSLLHYLPAEVICRMSEKQQAVYTHITLERLLTMSVNGYPFRPEGESWLEYSLSLPIDPTKTAFDYSNISAYLAGVAAANAVDEDLYEYLKRRLFNPLGIKDPPCGRCPDGYFYGASHMELTVNELSRIGLLLKNGGVYDDARLISEDYVKRATSARIANREGGYGYFIWKYKDGFSINGKWKQKCYVLPSSGIMLTFLSHIEEKCPELTASIEKYILTH